MHFMKMNLSNYLIHPRKRLIRQNFHRCFDQPFCTIQFLPRPHKVARLAYLRWSPCSRPALLDEYWTIERHRSDRQNSNRPPENIFAIFRTDLLLQLYLIGRAWERIEIGNGRIGQLVKVIHSKKS